MIRILFVLVVSVLFSCNDNKNGYAKDENDGDAVYSVGDDDADMNAAVEKANASYDDFLKAFSGGDSTLSDFTVKMKFPYDGGNEHMWLSRLFYEHGELYGVLDSDPVYISSVQSGDSLKIDRSRVSDWMYVQDNRMIGGYTIKVLYDKMTPKEKKEMREQLGLKID